MKINFYNINKMISRRLFPILFLLIISAATVAQTSGGPDNFGYRWVSSADAAGPVYNWEDITTTGTLLTGLADDNSVGPIPLGFSFRYYENTYNSIYIGSNGWISFNNVANISVCFPPIPTPGGPGDNVIYFFTADLIHSTNNVSYPNPAKAYYESQNNERFILTFEGVPFWKNGNPDFSGVNTFQLIISNIDTSIVFQYYTMETTLPAYISSCTRNTLVGFENASGTDGLEIMSDLTLPTSGTAIRIDCEGCFTSGLQEQRTNSVILYPNPADNHFVIEGIQNQNEPLIITDATGRIMQGITTKPAHNPGRLAVDISSLETGIYFVIIGSNRIKLVRE